jgi:Tfp pilus assembly protein PilX
MSKEEAEAWRELAVETIRNLSRLVEDAEALLRKAEQQLRDLENRSGSRSMD